jgi:hypothetical protein
MLAAVCLATVGAARTASATLYVHSPFPDTHRVLADVGLYPGNGGNYVFWLDEDTSQCSFSFLGNGSVAQNTVVYAPANAPFSDIQIFGGGSDTVCGLTVLPLVYGGFYVDLVGGAGSDTLFNVSTGDTFISGQGGNDNLVDSRPGATITGGTGNDTVGAANNNAVSYYDLGDGDDCLSTGGAFPPASRVICGTGFDTLVRGGPSTGQACERFTTNNCSF